MSTKGEGFVSLCNKLRANPSRQLWDDFALLLKDSDARHYEVHYAGEKVNDEQDLITSYATLFDGVGKEISKVPICLKEDDKIRGALVYLTGLSRM